MAQNSSQRSFIEFAMIRYDDLSEGIVSSENDVTSMLAFDNEMFLEKYRHDIASGNAR